MNDATKSPAMPQFVEPLLIESDQCMDNQFADACQELQIGRHCREANMTQRSGYSPLQVV